MEKLNCISVNVRGLDTDEKRRKIDSWLFDRKINVALLYKHILIENMNVNTTLVEKGKRFMHIGIQYLVGVYLFFSRGRY